MEENPKAIVFWAPLFPTGVSQGAPKENSSLLQVFDTWVSFSCLLPAVILLHQLLHRHVEPSFREEDRDPDPPSLSPCKEEKLKRSHPDSTTHRQLKYNLYYLYIFYLSSYLLISAEYNVTKTKIESGLSLSSHQLNTIGTKLGDSVLFIILFFSVIYIQRTTLYGKTINKSHGYVTW